MGVRLVGFKRVVGEDLRRWLMKSLEIKRREEEFRAKKSERGWEGRWEWVNQEGEAEVFPGSAVVVLGRKESDSREAL